MYYFNSSMKSPLILPDPIKFILLVIIMFVGMNAIPAKAITVNETVDFPSGASFDPSVSVSVGLLDIGVNSISGNLNGLCLYSAVSGSISCNSSLDGGDTQDSFLIEIESGTQIEEIYVTTFNVTGPFLFNVSFSLTDSSYTKLAYDYYLPKNSTTPNLVNSPISDGVYNNNMFGQHAGAEGAFNVDYKIDIIVGTIPIPAAVWLFGSGLIALIGLARRKTHA